MKKNYKKIILLRFPKLILVPLAKPISTDPVFADILGGNCSRVWGSTRIYALNAGATVQEADFIANGAWLACVGVI